MKDTLGGKIITGMLIGGTIISVGILLKGIVISGCTAALSEFKMVVETPKVES